MVMQEEINNRQEEIDFKLEEIRQDDALFTSFIESKKKRADKKYAS